MALYMKLVFEEAYGGSWEVKVGPTFKHLSIEWYSNYFKLGKHCVSIWRKDDYDEEAAIGSTKDEVSEL